MKRIPAAGLQAIDAAMAGFVSARRRAGLVYGIMQAGECIALEAFGARDLAAGLPMQPDTIFRVFSMTRALTTAAFLTLLDAQKLNLDDPVAQFIPALAAMTPLDPSDPTGTARRPLARPMTIRHLLTYTSGVGYSFDWPAHLGVGLADIIGQTHDLATGIGRLARCPLLDQPGDKWRYGFSSDILGRIIEIVAGVPLDVFLQSTVLGPLGMTDTGFWAGAGASRLAKAYGPTQASARADISRHYVAQYGDFRTKPRFLSAGGGLCATVPDWLKFSQFLLDGRSLSGPPILQPPTRAAMLRRQTTAAQGGCFWYAPNPSSYAAGYDWGYGIGIARGPADTPTPAPGAGWAGLMDTFFFIDPATELAAVVMSQYIGPDESALGTVFRRQIYQALT